jgi:hypothetical protein
LLIYKTSNGFSVANIGNEKSVAGLLASDYTLLILSNGISVAAKSATDKSVTKKSVMTNLHLIFAVADFIAKLF